MKIRNYLTIGLVLMIASHVSATDINTASVRPWDDATESRLQLAGTNLIQIKNALTECPSGRLEGLEFLIQNMPDADLRNLTADYLLDDVKLAYDAWENSPWHDQVPKDLFLNDVLPYASLSEARESWRSKLRVDCLPMVAGVKSPGEAAQILNRKIFPYYNVVYNTNRERPDQSPSQSMASGRATCTGLAILLVDACRAVGVPARIAGTPMWTNMRGNHTWVEVWDGGWHFVGAAEPDPAGLDHSWFVGDASKAQRDVAQHAIYASSFKRTDTYFPLVWLPGDESVPAANVTDRYTALASPKPVSGAKLSVKVLAASGHRVAATVTVTDVADSGAVFKDVSRDDSADMNDFVAFSLVSGHRYHVVAQLGSMQEETDVAMAESGDQLATLVLPDGPLPQSSSYCVAPPNLNPLAPNDADALKNILQEYFAATPALQLNWQFRSELEKLLAQNETAVRAIAWETFQKAAIHGELITNFNANLVRSGQYTSPYTVKKVGERPFKGWPLFIAMHGGGGAPKELNDSQWRHMQIYYKDHPEVGGYLYLALRAPNDTWNGFYDDYVYPLIDNLILQFRLYGDIDPDRVFIMGYSHGGYGAYAIGPKMPDRFAAIHASAAAATDGETTPKTLRTTPFTVMVGELDTNYDRCQRNLRFKKEVEQLRGDRTDIYPVTITVIQGNGHTGLPDRDLIPSMYPAVRNPVPRELDWLMTDAVVKDFFWLHVDQPGKGLEILASCKENRFVITANQPVTAAEVLMDSRMVDLGKPVAIELNGSTVVRNFVPSLKTFCETLSRRGDPAFAFSAKFEVIKASDGRMVVQ